MCEQEIVYEFIVLSILFFKCAVKKASYIFEQFRVNKFVKFIFEWFVSCRAFGY